MRFLTGLVLGAVIVFAAISINLTETSAAPTTDIVIKVRVQNVKELNRFVIEDLRSVDGIGGTQTLVVLNETNELDGSE